MAVQTSAYFALAKTLPKVTAFPEITAALDSLDDHLAYRTFLVGHDMTAADWIVWGALKGPSIMKTRRAAFVLIRLQAVSRLSVCSKTTSTLTFYAGSPTWSHLIRRKLPLPASPVCSTLRLVELMLNTLQMPSQRRRGLTRLPLPSLSACRMRRRAK